MHTQYNKLKIFIIDGVSCGEEITFILCVHFVENKN